MGISGRVIAVVGAGLMLAAGGCSRGEAEKSEAEAKAAESAEATAPGPARLESAIAGMALVTLFDLPRSPESGAVGEDCEGYRGDAETEAGRAVEARGWIVTSEAPLGRYRVVSFASGFDPATIGICTARNGNIGVFNGDRPVALAYAPSGSETIPGRVEALESGALLVWGGGYPGPPLGELRLDGDHPQLTGIAAQQTFCGRTATVPNVYGLSIEAARTKLIAGGWRPLPPDEAPDQYDRAAEMARNGIIEAQYCSGTGMGYCAFRYRGRGGDLDMTTADDAPPVVVGYGVICRNG